MKIFEQESKTLFELLGNHQKAVLSTSLNDKVTSRMMSIIILDGTFYFQTDIKFRKYEQIQKNSNVSLCIENIQIDGICKEVGYPSDNQMFCKLYHQHYPRAFDLYTNLKDERLFAITPQSLQKWAYENGAPFLETFDFDNKIYNKKLIFADNA